MGLKPAICTQCGGKLEVDEDKEAAVCTFCGMPFITEKAINNYITQTTVNQNTTVNTVTNVTGQTVNVFSDEVNKLFLTENGVLTKYKGCATNVIVPEGIIGIDAYAFKNKDLESKVKSIKLPSSLIRIEDDAFACCGELKEINIPDSVTYIGSRAFYGTNNLRSIRVPSSAVIDRDAFMDSGIESLPSADPSHGNLNFKNCKHLKKAIIPEGVPEIKAESFYGCEQLTELKLPSTLKKIGSKAFYDCKRLTEIELPDSLETIKEEAFLRCPLKSVELNEGLVELGARCFDGYGGERSVLESLRIPFSVQKIGDSALGGFTVKDLYLSSRIQFIGAAFIYCENLYRLPGDNEIGPICKFDSNYYVPGKIEMPLNWDCDIYYEYNRNRGYKIYQLIKPSPGAAKIRAGIAHQTERIENARRSIETANEELKSAKKCNDDATVSAIKQRLKDAQTELKDAQKQSDSAKKKLNDPEKLLKQTQKERKKEQKKYYG